MAYTEQKDIRTGKAPRHQAAAQTGTKDISNAEVKLKPSWRGKSVNEMDDAELNAFYTTVMKKGVTKDFNGKIYIMQNYVDLPQYDGTTPKMEEFLRKLAKRYLTLVKKAGYLVKSEEIRHQYNNGLIIKLYIRETSNSDVKMLPHVEKGMLNHLSTFTSSSIPMIIRM